MLNALHQTRSEQGLLSLTARSPSSALQTRTIIAYLLRQYFVLWLIALVVGMFTCLYLKPESMASNIIYLTCFSLLPLSLCIVKNHALSKGRYDSTLLTLGAACLLVFAVSLSSVMLLPAIAVWMPCALITLITGIALKRRWNFLMALPAVFPAGRSN